MRVLPAVVQNRTNLRVFPLMDIVSLTAPLYGLHLYLFAVYFRSLYSPISGIINVRRKILV